MIVFAGVVLTELETFIMKKSIAFLMAIPLVKQPRMMALTRMMLTPIMLSKSFVKYRIRKKSHSFAKICSFEIVPTKSLLDLCSARLNIPFS